MLIETPTVDGFFGQRAGRTVAASVMNGAVIVIAGFVQVVDAIRQPKMAVHVVNFSKQYGEHANFMRDAFVEEAKYQQANQQAKRTKLFQTKVLDFFASMSPFAIMERRAKAKALAAAAIESSRVSMEMVAKIAKASLCDPSPISPSKAAGPRVSGTLQMAYNF